MLESRTRGLLRLQGMFLLIVVPLWFLFTVILAATVFEKVTYSQVNFSVYLPGIAIACLVAFNPYARKIPRGGPRFQWVEAIRQTNSDTIVIALFLFGIVWATKDKAMSRIFLAGFLISTWGLLIVINRFVIPWMATVFFRGHHTINTVLLGSLSSARKIKDWIVDRPPIGMHFEGLVTIRKEEGGKDLPVEILGDISVLEKLIHERQISQIMLLESRFSKAWVTFVLNTCQREGCRLLIFNHWEEYLDQPLTPVTEGDHTFFTLRNEPLENPVNRVLKRIIDLAVSLPVVVTLLPLLCLWVKLKQNREAPGPLFYSQKRSGMSGLKFEILKFRTMFSVPPDRSDEARQASENDSRIFPFGNFLRRTSLDEFPQFINVLKGNMSVVGPRPHMIEHDEQFADWVEIYKTRHFVKPGITGLAQCKGYRGEVKDLEQIRERVRLDLEYINHWSAWLDIGIIIRTFFQVFRPTKSAY